MYTSKEKIEPLLWAVYQTKVLTQRKEYHPEIYVLSHLLQSFYLAIRESSDVDLIVAALIHDVGKVAGSLGHDAVFVSMMKCHCTEKTLWLIKNHIRIWSFLSGDMKKLKKVKHFLKHKWFVDLVHLGRIDKGARNPHKIIKFNASKIIGLILDLESERSCDVRTCV